MTLVDSNVLIDVLARDATWESWSLEAMQRQSAAGRLLINEIVYAEISAHYVSQTTVDMLVGELGVHFERTPRAGLHLAGRVFHSYRKRGGTRTSLLPDFLIGAHAAVARIPIITRDTRRYRTHFPEVELIAP